MPGPIGIFAAFVLARLGFAVLVGQRLGPGFSNITFFNALRNVFPELNAAQLGTLASAAIAAAKAGLEQSLLTPPALISPGDVPTIAGLSDQLKPGNKFLYRFRFGYFPDEQAPMQFTSGVFEFSGLVDLNLIQSVALATLNKRIVDSPEVFGFQQPGEVAIETLQISYIIQGV